MLFVTTIPLRISIFKAYAQISCRGCSQNISKFLHLVLALLQEVYFYKEIEQKLFNVKEELFSHTFFQIVFECF